MHIFNILASRARKLTSRLFHVAYCMSNYKYIPEHITMSFEPCFFIYDVLTTSIKQKY